MISSTNTTPEPISTSPAGVPPTRPLAKWLRNMQAEHTDFVIDAWLALDPESQDAYLAQMIAAAVNDGPNTALHCFGQTGRLAADMALAELNDLEVPMQREPWLDALGRYIIGVGNKS